MKIADYCTGTAQGAPPGGGPTGRGHSDEQGNELTSPANNRRVTRLVLEIDGNVISITRDRNQPVLEIVKWLKVENGYHFVNPDNTREDMFVHLTAIHRNNSQKTMRSVDEGKRLSSTSRLATSVEKLPMQKEQMVHQHRAVIRSGAAGIRHLKRHWFPMKHQHHAVPDSWRGAGITQIHV